MEESKWVNRHFEFAKTHKNTEPEQGNELALAVRELQNQIVHYRHGVAFGFTPDGKSVFCSRYLCPKEGVPMEEALASFAMYEKRALLTILAHILEQDDTLPYCLLYCDWSL